MTTRRIFVMALGALVPVVLLSLLFGNQWVIEALVKNDFDYTRGAGQLMLWLQYPRWRLTTGSFDWRFLVAEDVSTLLFFALVPVLTLVGARSLEPRRGLFGAVLTGWWASVAAGGVSGIVAGVLLDWAFDYPGQETSRTIFSAISNGACFGLAFGWLAGAGALVGFLVTRPREYAVQHPAAGAVPPPGALLPPGGPHPAAIAMPVQPTHGEGLPPQHPAAVPYVPPPGTPQQQPAWGTGQGPQYGSAYVQQQPAPSQPVAPSPAPGAGDEADTPAGQDAGAQSPSPAAAAPEEDPKPGSGTSGSAPADAPDDGPPDDDPPAEPAAQGEAASGESPADDASPAGGPSSDTPSSDTRPADATMVDHRPDEDDRPLPPPR
ncbi:hypothetical protein [Actinomadura roseirufa]|uniref:hypothetical protein n=1 Tax=Actinomadura roseirufa TaxID=2094049 RepID=UPI001041991E|nr:hypothetical protein [Actinomadura roseirufa]